MTLKQTANVNFTPSDQVFSLPVVYCSLLLKKILIFTSFLSIRVVLSCFYTPILYFVNFRLQGTALINHCTNKLTSVQSMTQHHIFSYFYKGALDYTSTLQNIDGIALLHCVSCFSNKLYGPTVPCIIWDLYSSLSIR